MRAKPVDSDRCAGAESAVAVGELVAVAEDRWAEGLSRAAHRAGGQIIAGEPITAWRVQAALADRPADEGAAPLRPPGSG